VVGNVKSNVKYHIFSISEVTTMAGAIIQNSIIKRPIIIKCKKTAVLTLV